MKKKSILTMLVIALMFALSLAVLSACGDDKDDNKNDPPVTYSLNVTGGTGGGEYAEGATVTITANAPETGKEFGRWEITGLDTSGLELSNAELTFTMPASDVTATALYSYIDYKVTVIGGTAQVDADAEPTSEAFATYECPVSIFADTAPTGQRFVRWTSEDGVVFDDATSAETTFTMPAKAVTVTAEFEYIPYTVTVVGGTAYTDGEPAGSITAEYGDYINIVAEVPTGKRFVKWTSDSADVVFDSETSETTSFEMPAGDITVTANYDFEDYEIKVTGGAAQVNDGGPFSTNAAHYGDNVKIKAHNPGIGMKFKNWTITGVDTSELVLTDRELTFTMPANAVTATANYEYIDYTVSVTGGTANKTTAHYGDSITITAAAPATGMKFTSWTLNGVTVEDTSLTELTFEMPANNVTATANYDFIDYTVSITGGTANKTTAHYDEEVTITAKEPEKGKEFDKWTVTGLDTAGLDLTKPELTFTMPTNAVTATAVFKDIDYEVKVICHNIETKTAHYGEEVTITAENIEGKIFVCWAFTNLDTEELDLTRAELSFTMPANNVTAKAIYEELITLTFEGSTAQSEELQYKDNDSKSFRLPLGSGQDLCTYTIELSNPAFTFKVYGSDGVEIEPYDNGDGFMCIEIEREDNYTIRVVNTGSAANCTLTVTQI